jgi:1-acyl-sn-glycerol-3-phosphate acyltransferase
MRACNPRLLKGSDLVPHTTRRSSLGTAYRGLATLVSPTVSATTKKDWRGTENLVFDGGCVIGANHISWSDPPILAQFIWANDRPPRFLGKESVFHVPIFGSLITSAGQIPVARDGDAAAAALAAIEAARKGETVVVYPEGTITKDPDLWPMCAKTGAARIALTADVPLIPVAQWGPQDILSPHGKALKLFPLKTVHMRVGPAIDLDDLRGREIDEKVLRVATARLMAAITSMLEDVRGEKAPQGCWDRSNSGERSELTTEWSD